MFKLMDRPDLVAHAYQKHLDSGQVTPRDVSLIKEYVGEKQGAGQVIPVRAQKITYTLLNWRRFLKQPYDQITMGDIYEALQEMPKSPTAKGTLPAQNTVSDWVRILKPFLLWLNDSHYSTLPEKKIRMIKAPPVDRDTKRPEDLLTIDDVKALIEGVVSTRDRAFVSMLYETGARVSELASLTWENVTFDAYGAGITLADTKSGACGLRGKTRYTRMTMFAGYLSIWKSYHPDPSPDREVFLDQYGKPMEYSSIRKLIQRAKERAGITKRVHPHLFRSSRITHMVTGDMNESIIKDSMWGNVGTAMFSTYVKLDRTDVDNEYLRYAGIERQEKKREDDGLRPRVCPVCHETNSPLMECCGKCGTPLTREAHLRRQTYTNRVMSEADVLEYVYKNRDIQ